MSLDTDHHCVVRQCSGHHQGRTTSKCLEVTVQSTFVTGGFVLVNQPAANHRIYNWHRGVVRYRGGFFVTRLYRAQNSLDMSTKL